MINQDKPNVGTPETYLNVGSGFNLLVGGVYKLIVGAVGLAGMTNVVKASIGETWGAIVSAWRDESRTWEAVSQLIGNVSRTPALLISEYDSSNYDSYSSLYSTSTNRMGQSFLNINEVVLDSVQFQLSNLSGMPAGENAYVKLYAHAGVFGTSSQPTGVAIATSSNVDVSTITRSPQMVEFKFVGSNRVTLSANTYYCIECNFYGGSLLQSLSIGFDISSPTNAGNLYYYTNAGALQTMATRDLIYAVYGARDAITNNNKPV